MEWIEHDDVRMGALPEWARAPGELVEAPPYRVGIKAQGLVLLRGRRASAVRWPEILAPIRVREGGAQRLLIAAARRPPREPWFDLGGAELDAIERAVRHGVASQELGSYRAAQRTRAMLSPEQVLEAVLAHRPLIGAVEIRTPVKGAVTNVVWCGIGGGGIFGYAGAVAAPMVGVVAPLLLVGAVGVLGVAVGAGVAGGYHYLARRRGERVLVLTPDCFVGGLDGRAIEAIVWSRVARFAAGSDPFGAPALESYTVEGVCASRTLAAYFGEPLHVIVAIAEAYRRRASAALGG